MDWEKAKRLIDENVPSLSVLPVDMNVPSLLAVRQADGQQVFSIQVPAGDGELAEAELLMMAQHARIFLLTNPAPKPPHVR